MRNKKPKIGTVTHAEVQWTSDALEALANGESVQLVFGDSTSPSTMGDVASMIIREMCSPKQISEFLNRHGISVRR